MGKNQQHKDRQRQMGSRGDGGGEEAVPSAYEGADVTFHTPEWHAARIAALTAERPTWEEWKKKEAEKDKIMDDDAAMRAYRAQLDADRAKALAKGTKNEYLKLALQGKKIKKKDSKKSKDKKKSKRKRSKEKDDDGRKKKKHKKSSKKKRKSSTSGSDTESSSSTGSDGSRD